MQVLFRWIDVAALAKALAVAMDGKPVVKEQVSLEQVRQFVGLDSQVIDGGSELPHVVR
jgi:hypothetical protein